MKPLAKLLFCLFLFTGSVAYGQMELYNYQREIKGIDNQWHRLPLPDEIFGKISGNFDDLRIYGITAKNDTIEAPFLLKLATEKTTQKDVAFKILNVSKNKDGHYFTFEIPTSEIINQISLNFGQKNFDWQVNLEGSQNQNEWFTVAENYRILSIKNEVTDFQFTKLTFPDAKYRYFRLMIPGSEKPELLFAGISQNTRIEGKLRNYDLKKFEVKENRENKETEIDVELPMPVPLGIVKINVKNEFDYYRPITIKYLSDSVKTEKGWKYIFNILTSGTLNSFESNEFKINSLTVKRLKIFISNQDNQPLTIESIQLKGYEHELQARFTEQATYFLTYGNNFAIRPQYDIDRFAHNVPKFLTDLTLGDEQVIEKEALTTTEPLFKNPMWLWAVIGLIMLLLGYFSIRMIIKQEQS
jgi:hypothetical protein